MINWLNECLALFLANCVTLSFLVSLRLSFQVFKTDMVIEVYMLNETMHVSSLHGDQHNESSQ